MTFIEYNKKISLSRELLKEKNSLEHKISGAVLFGRFNA